MAVGFVARFAGVFGEVENLVGGKEERALHPRRGGHSGAIVGADRGIRVYGFGLGMGRRFGGDGEDDACGGAWTVGLGWGGFGE